MMEGVELEFDPFAVDAIVKKAMERKTGARALINCRRIYARCYV